MAKDLETPNWPDKPWRTKNTSELLFDSLFVMLQINLEISAMSRHFIWWWVCSENTTVVQPLNNYRFWLKYSFGFVVDLKEYSNNTKRLLNRFVFRM